MTTLILTPNHWWEELAPETLEKLSALTDLLLEEIKINGVNRLIYIKISKDELAQKNIKNFDQAITLAKRISIEEKLFTVVNEENDILSMQMPSSEMGSTRLDRELENNLVFRVNTLNVIDALAEIKNALKEKSSRQNINSESETQEKPIWQDDFDWQGDKFVFGSYGEIHFDSPETKRIFRLLTDTNGAWVSIVKLRGSKKSEYVRSTISQIETRFNDNLKKYVSIPSTKDDNLQGKPDKQGAYRIKFSPVLDNLNI